MVIFTNRRSIRYVMIDHTKYEVAIKELHDARALDFDFQKNMVYWTDAAAHGRTIRRANFRRKPVKIQTILSKGHHNPGRIAVDWVGRKIYWTDRGKEWITMELLLFYVLSSYLSPVYMNNFSVTFLFQQK